MKAITVKKVFFLLVGLLLFGGLNGCATIISGSHQNVRITSNPDGVNFKIEDLTLNGSVLFLEGKTPSKVSLIRDHSYLVTLSKTGYEPEEIPIEHGKSNPLVYLNLILGGLVGLIIDGNTGAAFVLEPEEVYVHLTQIPQKQASNNFSPTMTNAIKDNERKIKAFKTN